MSIVQKGFRIPLPVRYGEAERPFLILWVLDWRFFENKVLEYGSMGAAFIRQLGDMEGLERGPI